MTDFVVKPVKACKKCGTADRYSDGHCKACVSARNIAHRAKNLEKARARSTAWNRENPERVKATNKKWQEENKDRLKAASVIYRAANAERYKAYNESTKETRKEWMADWYKRNAKQLKVSRAAYYASNPDARKAATQSANHNRRARKTKAGGRLSKNLAADLFRMQKGKCPCCRKPLGDDYHLDHVFPLAMGGTNTDDNMQLLRAECNQKKHAKHPIDFMQSKGFLL